MVTVGDKRIYYFALFNLLILTKCEANDILGCGGFVKSHVSLDFSKIEIGLYTKEGSLKEKTECAPTNGYYFLPLYEKGEYILKVHPPAGWSFEPSEVSLLVDGVSDQCSSGQDINFAFNGFGIAGTVITAGKDRGPAGIAVKLVNDKGEERHTVTTVGGDFHFTPVIPGRYTVKASHPRWKLEPSQAVVQVKEGNTALPVGVLAVKGYDVKGSVTAFGSPIAGVYILLYSKEDNPKFRIEGCNTALLQGVPDSPICHVVTDSSGEFTFGLVPAGDYKLLALTKSLGQSAMSFNIKTDTVQFTVQHDSLFIKNAFEVTGFSIIGSLLNKVGGKGVPGAQVLLDGQGVGKTDSLGKFTLHFSKPKQYTVAFRHEQCEVEEVQVAVGPSGPLAPALAVASRWKVCGSLTPPHRRRVLLTHHRGDVAVLPDDQGNWCTFLPPGVYTTKVDVSDQEQRDGLQFYPVTQKVTIREEAVTGVTFSQLKARVHGRVVCLTKEDCKELPLTLRHLSADGQYVGQPRHVVAKDGQYTFSEVLPGSVEVSVPGSGLCWAESRHNVAVTQQDAQVPDFDHLGYVIHLSASHDTLVEYSSEEDKGTWAVAAGPSQQCVRQRGRYALTPRSCHRFQPATAHHDTSPASPTSPTSPTNHNTVYLVAVAHAALVRVEAPSAVEDLVLLISSEGQGPHTVGPLLAHKREEGSDYVYEHTLYLKEGEERQVVAKSGALLVRPGGAQRIVGAADCSGALTLQGVPAQTLRGAIVPPLSGVTVTLSSDDGEETQVTGEDGKYEFGPVEASRVYKVRAELESYEFAEADARGLIAAQKLPEISVTLRDKDSGAPLQGALVSVSGGAFRRNAVVGPQGRLRFGSLAPHTYYVKPNMKEYRFSPPHLILEVATGDDHHLTLEGERVAWSCTGQVVSLGGLGWPRAALLASPREGAGGACATEEATSDDDGAFRIRGLVPGCVYDIKLKESGGELSGLKILRAPSSIEIVEKKDVEQVVVVAQRPQRLTDVSVVVVAREADHYRSLRVSLSAEAAPAAPLGSARLEGAGAGAGGALVALPRLPADNASYVLRLHCSLSRATHSYEDQLFYFNSDGRFKHFHIEFAPKVRTGEQELRQTSLLVLPLLGLLALAYVQRAALLAKGSALLGGGTEGARELLDHAALHHLVNAVNAVSAPKRPVRRRI